MRRTAMALLLLAGCASSGSNHDLGVTVFETVTVSPFNGVQAVTLLGSHMLRVQIENRSHQEITVHSIQLQPNDPDLFSDDPSQSIELLIGPGQSQTFDTYFNVSANSRTARPTAQMLESIRVDLSCTGTESGNFIAGGTYSVNHIGLGG
ncbi:MAG TPA: hypothetical protein VJ853_01785 [Thermoanaerobaculia bacterium]|nr:hypothetical protein [Thermoanaerobaculia bacterium]